MFDASAIQDPELRRILGQYTEMPGLQLTASEAARLWQLERCHCEVLLAALVEEGALVRTRRGAFVARTE